MKPIVVGLLLASSLAGCASGRYDVTPLDRIQGMRPDCTNANTQINWLQSQLDNTGYDPGRSSYEQKYVATSKELIWTLRSQCYQSVSSFKQFPPR